MHCCRPYPGNSVRRDAIRDQIRHVVGELSSNIIKPATIGRLEDTPVAPGGGPTDDGETR